MMGRTAARDILYISISFTAGTAISALVIQLCRTGSMAWILAAGGMAAAGTATTVFAAKGRSRFDSTPMFLALGLTCYAASAAGGVSRFAGPEEWTPATAAVGKMREAIAAVPFRYEMTGALLTALLTGSREFLTPEITSAFKASGASHILALSGLHLGIIYGILDKVLAPLGRSRMSSVLRSAATVSLCLFYALMTGCSPSIVRALLFICLNEIARHSPGRRKSSLAILCSALVIQLVMSPMSIENTGFQLSYLAMLGIFLIYPVLKGWYPSGRCRTSEALDPARRIWNSAAMSLSCQVFTAPLVWRRFGSLPGHFLLTNLLALPLVEALILSAIATLAANFFGWCPDLMIKCVDTLARALVFILKVISSM